MKKMMKLALAGAAIATGMVSNAAYAATEQADATVQVLAAVQLSAVSDLDFGVVAASAAGGTVTVGASAAATPSASGVIAISGGSAASFQVTQATNGEIIDLTVDNPAPLTGPGADITLSGLTLSNASITFNSASLQTVYVGGTITLNPNQVAGTYTGTFDVTAEYQ
jgi:Mat/Ecp fimbriae major subunit